MCLHCANNPGVSLKCSLHVEDRKLLLTLAAAARVTKACTFWSPRSHACFPLRPQPWLFTAAELTPLMPYAVVMLSADLVKYFEKLSAKWSWWKRRALATCMLALLVCRCTGCSCPGSLSGTDLNGVCLPGVPWFLGEGMGWGYSLILDELQTQTRDLTITKHQCLITFIHFVLEWGKGELSPGFIFKENQEKSQTQYHMMGSVENTLSWSNQILKQILSLFFVFKIYAQGFGFWHQTSWAIQSPSAAQDILFSL